MATYKLPGVTGSQPLPWTVDDGTSARTVMACPGSICSDSNRYPTRAMFQNANDQQQISLDFLFVQCLSPQLGLTQQDFEQAATELGVDVEAVMAIAEVETQGAAFDNYGRPRILFERHYFHKLTAGKYSAEHPDFSNKTAGGYGKFSIQYDKLHKAYQLDQEAALKSASWGSFQIMGANYAAAGFANVRQFVLAMTKSEAAHLKAFVNFVKSRPSMLKALREKRWADFAKFYNGPGYQKNNYDTKLEEAYDKFHQQMQKLKQKTPSSPAPGSGSPTPSPTVPVPQTPGVPVPQNLV